MLVRMWLSLAMMAFTSGTALAQTAWPAGTWKGTQENLRNDPNGAERVLVITADGKCAWDYPTKIANPAKHSCTFAGDTVSFVTPAGSMIKLQLKDGKVQGIVQMRSGISYQISMLKQ